MSATEDVLYQDERLLGKDSDYRYLQEIRVSVFTEDTEFTGCIPESSLTFHWKVFKRDVQGLDITMSEGSHALLARELKAIFDACLGKILGRVSQRVLRLDKDKEALLKHLNFAESHLVDLINAPDGAQRFVDYCTGHRMHMEFDHEQHLQILKSMIFLTYMQVLEHHPDPIPDEEV